jgi:hypothetical protein
MATPDNMVGAVHVAGRHRSQWRAGRPLNVIVRKQTAVGCNIKRKCSCTGNENDIHESEHSSTPSVFISS